jgi:hypothetical protein
MSTVKRIIFYKLSSLILAISFAILGLIFLLIPGEVLVFFNNLSMPLRFPQMPIRDIGFYNILAVGYMYVVTLLAVLMARHTKNRILPLLLVNAKLASAVISIGYFIFYRPFLIFLANGIIDSSIAIGVIFLDFYLLGESINLHILILEIYLPRFIKRKKLLELFDITATAFQVKTPNFSRPSHKKSLNEFALFSKNAAETAMSQKQDMQPIRQSLHDGAYKMGLEIRQDLHINTSQEIMAACRILYRAIGIDFKGNQNGEITIGQCYFSEFYSSGVCKIISALDEGLIAGLSDGGHLIFRQRITDGKDCCIAQFIFSESMRPGMKI